MRVAKATLNPGDRETTMVVVAPDHKIMAEKVLPAGTDRADVTLSPGVEVVGTVRDREGKPVGGVTASLTAMETAKGSGGGSVISSPWFVATSDATGKVVFRMLAGYKVWATYTKYGWVGATSASIVVPEAGQAVIPEVRIVRCDAAVSGVVRNVETGNAIPGTPVQIDWPNGDIQQGSSQNRFVFTDSAGRFSFAGVPRGKVALRVPEPFVEPGQARVVRAEAPASGVEVRLQSDPPEAVRIGVPVLPDSEVDRLGDNPVIADGESTLLVFVTANDSASGRFLETVHSRAEPRNGRWMKTVVVFDSALSLEETRRYARDWGVESFAVRIKETTERGRHSTLFRRYKVDAVPKAVALDRAGKLMPGDTFDLSAPAGRQSPKTR